MGAELMEGEESGVVRRPGIQLTRVQLTGILVGIPIIGLCIAWMFTLLAPNRPEAKLGADVSINFTNWAPPGKDLSQARLMACVIIENKTDEVWNHVTVALDKQFYYNHHLKLGPGERLACPLETFITKGGNITFRPSTQSVKRVTVFAQVPSGERAVIEVDAPYSADQ